MYIKFYVKFENTTYHKYFSLPFQHLSKYKLQMQQMWPWLDMWKGSMQLNYSWDYHVEHDKQLL